METRVLLISSPSGGAWFEKVTLAELDKHIRILEERGCALRVLTVEEFDDLYNDIQKNFSPDCQD